MTSSEHRNNEKRARFQALDGWRGICALFVALFHIPIKDGFLGASFFNNCYLLVDFFFVLSGFVINHSYKLSLCIDPTQRKKFLLGRVARLWPLHIAMFGCYAIINFTKLVLFGWYHTASGPPPTITGLIITSFEQCFLLQALVPSPAGVLWNGQSWSVSTEFWTYVLFMAVIVGCSKRCIFAALIAAVSAFEVIMLSNRGMDVTNWIGFFRCFYGFFVGYLVYEYYSSHSSFSLTSKWIPALPTLLEILCIFFVVIFLIKAGRGTLSFFSPLLFAFVIYVFAADAGRISRVLSSNLSQLLGRYSYSMYMTFGLVITIVVGSSRLTEKIFHVHLIKAIPVEGSGNAYLIHFGPKCEMIELAGIILVSVVLMSHYTYRFIEIPCQAFVKKIGRKFLSNSN